jgi:hypothetical protein
MPHMGLEVETHALAEHYAACPSKQIRTGSPLWWHVLKPLAP